MEFNSLHIEKYREPKEEEYLWRYIKPKYIDSFLNGDIYFAMLSQFNDSFEAIEPTHYFVYQFLNRGLGQQFDFSKHVKELNSSEEVMGTLLMSMGVYDLEKKLSRITGITERSELSALIKHHVENMNDFIQPQFDFQSKHYASCWFVGDHIESALMWSAYSEPNGIAVRIKYKYFKDLVENYFGNIKKSTLGIEECYAGLIDYCDYNDPDDWLAKIENGENPIFFKQQFYKDEREFRFVLKRYGDFPEKIFKNEHKVFVDNTKFNIILHPTSGPVEIGKFQSKLTGDSKFRVSMSEMSLYR